MLNENVLKLLDELALNDGISLLRELKARFIMASLERLNVTFKLLLDFRRVLSFHQVVDELNALDSFGVLNRDEELLENNVF
jgi:hypothetical protein